jgi:alpha-L-rhamnosidase
MKSKNQNIFFISICFLFLSDFVGKSATLKGLRVTDLRTEYQTEPMGIAILIPRLSWKLISPERNVVQTAYEIKAGSSLENLKTGKALLWDSGKKLSAQSVHIEYAGIPLYSGERVYWQVRTYDNRNHVSDWSDVASFEMGLLAPSDWKANWIEPDLMEDTLSPQPCPMLRKEFRITKKIKQARAYISSRGLYSAMLNGKKVGDQLFTPGWTSYHKRLQYQTYDITNQLQSGKNAIGVTLGDGWFRGYLTWDKRRNVYGSKLALIVQIEITYADNTTELISSDKSWKSSTGPILKSDIYDGETYDARLEKTNWNTPDYSDENWNGVKEKDFSKEVLFASYAPGVKEIEEIKPLKIFRSPEGDTLVDMGQNMVGWIRLEITGKTGNTVTLKYAEVLDKNGNFYTGNLRNAAVTDKYILKGGGLEVAEPHFTFHGFRYVKLMGYPGLPTLQNIRGIVIHSDMPVEGSFSCSDSLINQLQHNIVWGLKGNFLDIPTDCPQRDERMGWTGDAQVFSPTACFNRGAATFYTKWMKDFTADQFNNGSLPFVIPDILHAGGAAGWSDAGVVIPWTIYLKYGDTRILSEQYESMKGWINYMKNTADDSTLWKKGDQFGDWLAFHSDASDYQGATTDKDLIATAYYAYSTSLMQKIATILDKKQDADRHEKLFNKIRKAFQQEYMSPNGRLSSNTQTAYVLALAFNLIPDSLQKKSAERLANDVNHFGHITTGFLGTPLICEVLTKYGYVNEAYVLLMNKKYPSWLYPITMGATTIWERWDGIKPDGTFQDNGMNSLNHYAYGAIGNWLYSSVAGLESSLDEPGYQKIIFNPHVGGNLTFAKADYNSVYGKILSDWKVSDHEFEFHVSVPPNTHAEVYLPSADKDGISESGKPVSSQHDIQFISSMNGQSLYKIGSGDYYFKTKLTNKAKLR